MIKYINKGYLCALGAVIIWAGNFIIARGMINSIPPVTLAWWRWVIATLFLLPFSIKSLINNIGFIKKHILYLSLTSLFGVTIFNTFVYIAAHTTSALNLSIIAVTCPIFIIIFERIFFKNKFTLYKIIGVIITVFGVLMLITDGEIYKLFYMKLAKGDIWMLTAAICFGAYSILIKRKPDEINSKVFLISTFLIGLILLTPFYIVDISYITFTLSTNIILSILYVGLLASLLAYILWNKAIATIGPAKSGLIYYLIPVFSAILGNLILDEKTTIIHVLSIIIVISGILLANRKWKRV